MNAGEQVVDATSVDPRTIAAMADPYPLVNNLRESCPVSRSELHGGFWNLFRYEDVCAAAADPGSFSSRDITIPSEPLIAPPVPISIDPPAHMEFRRPLLKRFSPEAVADLEPIMRAKVGELFDGFAGRGCADLVQDVFLPVPAYAALQLLSLPEADYPSFARWAQLAFTIPDESSADINWEMEVAAYFAPMYEAKAGSTDDDIPSIARRIVVEGREIDLAEYVMLLITLVVGGLDTTTNAAAQIALLLDERDDLRQVLVERPELLPSAIEEFLRYTTPLPTLGRVATTDVILGTPPMTIREGDKVALHWLSANHDPAEFPNPETLDLERKPNRHVAFGRGPHRCIGMHLARLELKILLEELLIRIPDYRVDRGKVVRAPGVTRQVHNLPITFGARGQVAP